MGIGGTPRTHYSTKPRIACCRTPHRWGALGLVPLPGTWPGLVRPGPRPRGGDGVRNRHRRASRVAQLIVPLALESRDRARRVNRHPRPVLRPEFRSHGDWAKTSRSRGWFTARKVDLKLIPRNRSRPCQTPFAEPRRGGFRMARGRRALAHPELIITKIGSTCTQTPTPTAPRRTNRVIRTVPSPPRPWIPRAAPAAAPPPASHFNVEEGCGAPSGEGADGVDGPPAHLVRDRIE